MYKIVDCRFINPSVKLFEIEAPAIATNRRAKPGQFIILRINEDGERIPITIADCNPQTRTVTIIVQGIGKTTNLLLSKEKGDFVLDIVGPLGKPTHIEKFGVCVVIGGGVGTAIAYPTAKALKEAGNKVIVIIGGRTAELAILKDEISAFADEVYVTTDDGSAGEKGLVTDKLRSLINTINVDYVLAIGPIMMMKAVADTTNTPEHIIPTVVSLNPVMLDGTGMCGGCRAIVGGKNVFVCVDGPEFDAHQVDFNTLLKRNASYAIQESCSLCAFKEKYGLLNN